MQYMTDAGVEVIEDQIARHGFEAAVPLHSDGLAQCGDHAMPALLGVGAARIEHEAHGDVERRTVFSARSR